MLPQAAKTTRKKSAKTTPKDFVPTARAYALGVVSGEIPACAFVRAACKRQLDDIEKQNDPSWPFVFDHEAANRPCRFLEKLRHVEGHLAGQPLVLAPWQVFVITVVYGWKRKSDGLRRFREATVFVPKKNGKSTMAAGLALFGLLADGEGGAQVFSIASAQKQARICFDAARAMLNKSPEIRDRLGAEVGQHAISQASSNSTFKPLSSESGSNEGLNPHVVIVDEVHAHKDRAAYDGIRSAIVSRAQPLLWVISTAGADAGGASIGYEVWKDAVAVLQGGENETLFAIIFAADPEDDWTSPETWKKANPNLGVSVRIEALEVSCKEAQRVASKRSEFFTKHLNRWVGAASAFLSPERWDAAADRSLSIETFEGESAWVGLDLAAKTDIAAKVTVFKKTVDGREHFYAFAVSYLPEAAVDDGRNASYRGWALDGHLTVTPGDVLDFEKVKSDIEADAARFTVEAVAYDPWQALNLAQGLDAAGLQTIEVRPTVANFSAPMKEVEALLAEGRFHHDGNPAFRWQALNVVAHRDAKDNVYPRKERPESKIDAFVALLMALSRALLDEGASVYSTRGLVSI